MNECLRKGYLLKCPQKARAFKKWNSRWFVLYGNSPRGRVRLEYYDSEKAWQQERGKRIIPLVHCVSIKPVWHKDYNHVLEIVTSDKTFYLGAGSKDEEKAWFKALCKVAFGNANRNSIVHVLDRPDPLDMGYHSLDRGNIDDSNLSGSQASAITKSSPHLSTITSSRDKLEHDVTGTSDVLNITTSSVDATARNAASSLSCELSSIISFESGFDDSASVVSSVNEGGTSFHVSVRPTIASQEAGMIGSYVLQITPTNLTLIDIATQSPMAEWPIQHLRRYGRGRTKFSFEAGDKCKSGVGVYTFNTGEGDAIFHLIDMYARKISSLQRKDTREKRISMPTESFRPLNESRRRAKSEGKLLESSDDSTINELNESFEKIAASANAQTSAANHTTFPSKTRLHTLDVIKDQEYEKQSSGSSSVRPRSFTDVSVGKDFIKRRMVSEDQSSYTESNESLRQNPANSDFDLGGSFETVKGDTKGSLATKVGSIEQEQQIESQEQNKIDLKSKDDILRKVIEQSVEAVLKVGDDSMDESLNNGPVLDDGRKSSSPFEPLVTSEQAPIESSNDFKDGGREENDGVFNKEEAPAPREIPRPELVRVTSIDIETGDVNETLGPTEEEVFSEIEVASEKDSLTDKESLSSVDKESLSSVEAVKTTQGKPKKKKTRSLARRNKSFEFGSMSEKSYDSRKQSGSFSAFDYRKYKDSDAPYYKIENGHRKLQRFASVKKTVEMYEKLSVAACEARSKGFTLWRKKSFKSSQKAENGKKTSEKSS